MENSDQPISDKEKLKNTNHCQKINWIRKYNTEIIAISAVISSLVTIILATIAFQSWVEVKEQRDLIYQQFRQTNLPELEILFPETFESVTNKVSTKWGVRNNGGTAEDIRRAFYIIYKPENQMVTRKLLDSKKSSLKYIDAG